MKFNYKATKANPSSAVFVGYIFIIIGFVLGLLTLNPLALLILGGVGSYFVFSYYGFQINDNQTEFREYFGLFGFKKGKWQPLSEMPYITVFYITQAETTGAGRSMQETTLTEKVYKVFLLNETHRQRALIKITPNENEAKQIVHDLTTNLPLTHVKYQPKTRTNSKRR